RYVPAIASAEVVGTRACARPVTPDGRPLVGPIPGIGRAFIAAGPGPWGLSTGPGSSRIVADLLLGRLDFAPVALDPGRFGPPGGGGPALRVSRCRGTASARRSG